jgi:hypothetical protein
MWPSTPESIRSNTTGLEMDKRELNRYKQVLLAKRGELSVKNANGESPVPAAGGWHGDPIDQATAMPKQSSRFVCIKLTAVY